MKARLFVALILGTLFCLYAQGFAQDAIPVFNESQAQEQAGLAPPPDTPVNGIGDTLSVTYGTFLSTIAKAASGMGSALAESFGGVARAILTLAIAILSIRMLNGDGQTELKKFGAMMFLTVVITGIVFQPGQYNTWISDPILGTIDGLGSFMVGRATGGQSGDMVKALAGGMDKIMAACVQLDRVDSWMPTKLIAALVAQIALSASYLMVMVTFLLICIMSWFAVYLMMVFGNVCLFFAIFSTTRHIFWAWLRAVCNYGMVIIFASLIMGVCLTVMLPQLEILSTLDYGNVHPLLNGPTYTCLAINVLSWCMLLRAPDLAAALTGGSAGNTAGIAGVVSMTAGAAYSGMKYLGLSAAPQAAGNMASWAKGSAGSTGGGSIGSLARRAGGAYGPSARKGIDNSSF